LYNDAEIREDLEREGVCFRTSCDTETVLMALAQWGEEALGRLRGMFALCFYDTRTRGLIAARDPLGIKPLYHTRVGGQIVLASEIPAILEHPRVTPEPNMRMVSAYLTTIRTVLGDQTMFEGVRALEAGQILRIDASGDTLRVDASFYSRSVPVGDYLPQDEAAGLALDTMQDSVERHLRSDVPICTLLSGGLDSSIITLLSRERHPLLRTYCAGSPGEQDDDLAWASRLAEALGTDHDEALVDQELFSSTWPELVAHLGVPLSTPNEVAIYAVASRLREDGCVVTLSGEGADELFAGYEPPMDSAWQFSSANPTNEQGGLFQLDSNAWISRDLKQRVLHEAVWSSLEHDTWLSDEYEAIFARCICEVGEEAGPVRPHLRFHQRVNLSGLLQRLDTSTMRASVEGRTPFADRDVLAFANSLSDSHLYSPPSELGGGVGVLTPSRTKRVLRRAFGSRLPEDVLARPKASFPLPFMHWLSDASHAMVGNAFLDSLLVPEALEAITADPNASWQCAWPMMNIAFWSEGYWT
jgi:asparagine synthase (glutamine-hydrolysing)